MADYSGEAMKNPYQQLSITTLTIIFCLNFTQGSTDWDDKKPSWNCQGTLVDSEGREHEIEFMTISGLYEKIPVYYEPDSPDKKPAGHTQLISLRDIKEISADPVKGKKTFMDRNYIEITVQYKKGSKHKYLVEEYRELWYFLPKGPSGRAEVKFDRIKSLTIDKCAVRMPEEDNSNGEPVKKRAKNYAHTELESGSFIATMKDKLNVAFTSVRDSFKHLFV